METKGNTPQNIETLEAVKKSLLKQHRQEYRQECYLIETAEALHKKRTECIATQLQESYNLLTNIQVDLLEKEYASEAIDSGSFTSRLYAIHPNPTKWFDGKFNACVDDFRARKTLLTEFAQLVKHLLNEDIILDLDVEEVDTLCQI